MIRDSYISLEVQCSENLDPLKTPFSRYLRCQLRMSNPHYVFGGGHCGFPGLAPTLLKEGFLEVPNSQRLNLDVKPFYK